MQVATSILGWGSKSLAVVRLKPFGVATAEGRAQERVRRLALTAITSALAKALAMGAPLVTTPLTLGYFGMERYGLWMTVSSVVGMLVFADLGLCNGLMTSLARAQGIDDRTASARYVASAFYMLGAVGGLLAVLYAAVYAFVPWPVVFNATSAVAARECGGVMTATVLCFLLYFPLATVTRTQSAYQEGFQSNLWQCAVSLITVGVMVGGVHLKLNLPWFVFCVSAVPVVVGLVNGGVFFGCHRPWLRPSPKRFDRAIAKRLMTTGFQFFLLSLLMAFGLYTDNLIVAHVLGGKAVPQYAIPARVAAFLVALPQMIYLPLWTANGEALARGDVGWVRANTRRMIVLLLALTVPAALVFVCGMPGFLAWWIGPELKVSFSLLAGLGFWAITLAVAGPLFMVLNAANCIKVQLLMFGVLAVFSIWLKIVLSARYGVAGIVWGSNIAYVMFVFVPLLFVVRKVFARLPQEAALRLS